MKQETLSAIYGFNSHANHIVLDAVSILDEETFTQQASPSHGNVQTMLRHIFEGEKYFLLVCQGGTFQPELDESSSLEDIHRYWQAVDRAQRDFIASLSKDDLTREIDFQFSPEHPFHLPMWQLLLQSMMHSHHHRGELSIVLTELGHPLPTIDTMVYFIEQSGQEWPY